MNIIKPARLEKGDTISIVAPSGCISYDKILNAKKYFEDLGYKIKLGANIQKKDRYMAGSDEDRIKDLHTAFVDKEIKAIICARGGYGAIRIINKIDYNLIKNNPKIFCGYSDITALSAMIYKKTGLITFSGPMIKSDFQPDSINNFTVDNFWETLTNDHIKIVPNNNNILLNLGKKTIEGILWGGNLATIASLCGQDFIPDENFIFFTEDLNEPVYKIDRYFRQILNIAKFKRNLKAILVGEFLDVEDNTQLSNLFKELAIETQVPIIGTFKISHGKEKITVPFGGYGTLNKNTLSIKY